MKGIALPITAIVTIALGLLVMVVLASSFIKGGAGLTRTQKTQQLVQSCQMRCNFFKQVGQDWEGDVDEFVNAYKPKLQYYAKNCLNIFPCTFEVYNASVDEYVMCSFKESNDKVNLTCGKEEYPLT